jgi:tRNA-Thr(GGU) m(6)t(6)A37 methyltransferase TsaA
MEPLLKFIGKVNSQLKRKEDCPLQEFEDAPEAEILIFPEFAEGMKDIVVGSEILLLTWLHIADRNVITTQPRNNPKAKFTGVFSTRSPDRPNPIGMHTVKIISISDRLIKVSGLEVLDQTPVVDIKPVLNK